MHRPLLELASTSLNRKPDALGFQYRSHPQLTQIITPLVYGRQFTDAYKCRDPYLIAGVYDFMHYGQYSAFFGKTWDRELVFDINGNDIRRAGSTSRYNPGSAGAILRFLYDLCNWHPDPEHTYCIDGLEVGPRRVRLNDIGIISTYKDHVRELKKLFEKMANGGLFLDQPNLLKISTVDGYQGSERSIIIADLVVARDNSGSYRFVADSRKTLYQRWQEL